MANKKLVTEWQDVWLVSHMHSGMCDPELWPYTVEGKAFCNQYRRQTGHHVGDGEIINRCVYWRKKRHLASTPKRLRVCFFKGPRPPCHLVGEENLLSLLRELYQKYKEVVERLRLTTTFDKLYKEFIQRSNSQYNKCDVYRTLLILRKRTELPRLEKEYRGRDVKREGGFFTKEQVSKKGVVRDPGNW